MTIVEPAGRQLERRLASLRRHQAGTAVGLRVERQPTDTAESRVLAERLAAAIDAEVVTTAAGTIVRRDVGAVPVPIDRGRLATLPGQPPPDVPLVCLDTETTGLATAAGTMAFLVGLGRWHSTQFRVIQLLLPDQSDEQALLAALAAEIPADAWLVTYNGRTFDWPLLVTRYRMAGSGPPPHAGHLDLLPFVRRVFRHRMADARLRSVEHELLGLERHGDVEGWEIPGRYIDFLHGGSATQLADVTRHNDEDVVSLARLLAHVERGFASTADRAVAHRGDLAGLARSFSRARRLEEALECLVAALAQPDPAPAAHTAALDPFGPTASPTDADDDATDPWWRPRRRPDFGGRPRLRHGGRPLLDLGVTVADPWTRERIAVEQARVLRRLGRFDEAVEAWRLVTAGGGSRGVVAWIEIAKLREHRLGDPIGAFDAVRTGWQLADRNRRLGRPLPHLEADLVQRGRRLRRRLS
jgi:hypothetical protein